MKQLYCTHLLLDYQLFKLNQSLFLPKLLPADVESTKLSLGCRVHQASLIVRDVNAITIPKDAHLPVSAKVARTPLAQIHLKSVEGGNGIICKRYFLPVSALLPAEV